MAAASKRRHHEGRKDSGTTGELLKTRICIKNVDTRSIRNSQKLREQLLRQIKNLKITDALVLPERRLAWVGLETAEMAERCIAFLNQTYALGGTHKITVEYASRKSIDKDKKHKNPGDEVLPATETKSNVPEIIARQDDSSSLKRKHNFETDDDASKKRPTQSFWANDDIPQSITPTVTSKDETANTPNGDLEFLRSKQVPVEDLEEEDEEDTDIVADKTSSTRRLFIRNLPYTATESQLVEHFSEYGTVSVKIIVDTMTDQSKGYGFVECSTSDLAQSALDKLDGSEFQGRVLSVMFAEPPRENNNTDATITTAKFQSQKDRGQGLAANHVRSDAVLDAVANALGVGQGDVLSVKGGLSAGDAAVRLALGETAVIQENRNYLSSHGYELNDFIQLVQPSKKSKDAVNVDTENAVKRSKTALLVKNLPFDTTVEDLSAVFTNASSILLTPSHTLAVVHFADALLAKNALRRNAYRRFKKSVPLYLEWAPERRQPPEEDTVAPTETMEQAEEAVTGDTGTLYVKNLNFKTTETQLLQAFEGCGARSVRIPQKTSTTGQQQSLGYGFIEFPSSKEAAMALEKLQGTLIDDHKLELAPRKQQGQKKPGNISNSDVKTSKLMVRNVPFQANRKELLQLFGQFGTLKRVRLPKKFDASQHRGFGFVEYVSHKEATAAKVALANTHLYGRHLIIEYAQEEEGVK
jgi:multiple RNA-binding domain-containing protein 1